MKRFLLILLIVNCQLPIVLSQWVQQTLPVSAQPFDLVFFDANTGLISLSGTPALLYRTTDSGFNWTFVNYIRIFNFDRIDNQAVYGNGRTGGNDIIYRSTNRGLTWDSVSITPAAYTDLSFINRDTGWVCGHNGSQGAIWRTTNGGVTLIQQLASGTSGMDRIFFLKQKVNGEYTGWCSQGSFFRKTTNGGVNWIQTAPITVTRQIFFINKDTGWVSNGSMFRCTDGGINWIYQPMPTDASFVSTAMLKFVVIDKNIIYGVGGNRFLPNFTNKGVIWKTTNGGVNWGYQQPDTAIPVAQYTVIDFIDSLTGWAYNGNGFTGSHTTNGGGPIIFTAINQISTEVPTEYKLFQNYPNPFNPITNIKYEIVKSSYVTLKIYDALGKEIETLVNQKQNIGTYLVDWNAFKLPSGIYFYTLLAGSIRLTRKMILIK